MAQAIPVLTYHHVSPSPGRVTVSPETFAAHMRLLAHCGWTALTTADFAAFVRGEKSVPRKSLLITFDDGYLDNYVYAHPLLLEYGMRAALFAVTGWVGEGLARTCAGSGSSLPETPDHRTCSSRIESGNSDAAMLRWSEIEAMIGAGTMECHSHSHSHVRWDRIHTDRRRRMNAVEADLALSRRVLENRFGAASEHLCWPWGYNEAEYSRIAEELGFRVLYTVEKGTNASGGNPAEIHRVVLNDRPRLWLGTQLWFYSGSARGRAYTAVRGV